MRAGIANGCASDSDNSHKCNAAARFQLSFNKAEDISGAIHANRLAARQWLLPVQADNEHDMKILPENSACIVLAAGQSRRFGAADKLLSMCKGIPLISHSARMLGQIPFARRIVIGTAALCSLEFEGFETIETDDEDAPQSHSIRLGVEAVLASRPDAIMIALGDMPMVPASHIFALFEQARGSSALVVSSNGTSSMPPALFGRDHFAALQNLTGDHGARHLLAMGKQVMLRPDQLIDIDTLQDLDELGRNMR
jgi:molybdenum cofactor cytidylyltransferase